MKDPTEREEIIRSFTERWMQDREEGLILSLEEYLQLFPGDADGLSAQHAALEARTAAPPTPKDEQVEIGPYRTVRELGRGGQGVVYLAEDARFGRTVALKVLGQAGPRGAEVLARFRREALVASRLNHPGICGVLDAEIESGIPYIAMPFIEGQTLARRIEDTRQESQPEPATEYESFDDDGEASGSRSESSSGSIFGVQRDASRIERLLLLFEKAARALHAAHEAGVVHRDLKPANIMVAADEQPVLLDFGLAMSDDDDLQTLTRSGEVFGTPAYMSPEQLTRGTLRIDRRTDVYSLGATLYESLTLQRPFQEPTREALYNAILTRDPASPRSLNPRVSRDLAIVVSKALEKDRERRYETAQDLADELRRVRQHEPILARPVGPLQRSARWARRNPVVASLLLLVILVLSLATALTSASARDARRALGAEREARSSENAANAARDETLAQYERLADTRRLATAKAESDRLWPIAPDLEGDLLAWQAEYGTLLQPETLADHTRVRDELRRLALPYTDEERQREFEAEIAAIEELDAREPELRETLARDEDPAERQSNEERMAALVAKREELRERMRGRRSWRFDDADIAFRHEVLSQLIDDLGAFASPEDGNAAASIADRLQRARRIARLTVEGPEAARRWRQAITRIHGNERYHLSAADRQALGPRAAPASLFDASGAMTLSPQMGLIPLGPDPASGLEEFLHLESHGEAYPAGDVSLPDRRSPANGDNRTGIAMMPETGIILVLIPAGTFLMGSQKTDPEAPNHDPGSLSEEAPVHEVQLGAFFLSKYELTQGQWARLATRTGVPEPRPSQYGLGAFPNRPEIVPSTIDDTHPVEQVDWSMATELTRRIGLVLPTEAQWERAARANRTDVVWTGTTAIEEIRRFGNICGTETIGNGSGFTPSPEHRDAYVPHAPVGSFLANDFGLHDMTGNVWEWCMDEFAPYTRAPFLINGQRLADSGSRICRGGSYFNRASHARIALRYDYKPALRIGAVGLRPARDVTVD